jgi:molecular chaperone GrpE
MMTDPSARQAETADAEPENTSAKAEAGIAAEQGDPLAEAMREAAQYKDKLLRMLAEMENLRKRTEREVADARLYGNASFARDVLAVADNMQRAFEAMGPELREQGDAKVKALVEGVELTERELLNVLEKHGVKKFSPAGERFDPNVHQAMYEVENPELPTGHVAQVIQAGYMLGDRVLRPALVAIVKAASKAPLPSANDNPNPPAK